MRTLREEIQSKIAVNEHFQMDEILEIYNKIQDSLHFLYEIDIFPSFLSIDNICYVNIIISFKFYNKFF